MGNGDITDAQITASSFFWDQTDGKPPVHRPQRGRLNSVTVTGNGIGGWAAGGGKSH